MRSLTANFWPSARQFAEAVQCPAVCFEEPTLRGMLPAVDRLGMPLVTSGQFAYVFKLNAQHQPESLAVRCFRGFLGDREERYRALDAHLGGHRVPALPRFKYLSKGILVAGQRFPVLVMEWVSGPTLDVYLEETAGRREIVTHLAEEWLRLMASLRGAGVAHGDLQHGNVIVERGQLRLVDLDGVYVPALAGLQSSEVGHQHYQHPARDARLFSPALDHFPALVVYLSLISLAERPELWAEHHDENLLFTRADFQDPEASELFRKVRELGPEHARLADALASAAKAGPEETPWLLDLVESTETKLPAWMNAPAAAEVGGRTREVARASVEVEEPEPDWRRGRGRRPPTVLSSGTVQTIFGASAVAPSAAAPLDPSDIRGNTLVYAKRFTGGSYVYIWWLAAHNFLLEPIWGAFGFTAVASVFYSLIFLGALCLLYGLARALYESETATPPALPAGAQPAASASALSGASAAAQAPLFGPSSAPPAPAVRVVGNRTLNIYHLPNCVWADRIAPRNRVEFDSPASAKAAGHRPCHVCAP